MFLRIGKLLIDPTDYSAVELEHDKGDGTTCVRLRAKGSSVVPIELPDGRKSTVQTGIIDLLPEASEAFRWVVNNLPQDYGVSPYDIVEVYRNREKILARLAEIKASNAARPSPATPSPAPVDPFGPGRLAPAPGRAPIFIPASKVIEMPKRHEGDPPPAA